MKEEDLLQMAWALITNASNRTIDMGPIDASPGWPHAAVKFRKEYFDWLENRPYVGKRVTDGGVEGTLVRCENCQDPHGLLFKPDETPEPVEPNDS